ncbi:hypothetical protein RHGRI_023207 [Rhododendron griersonianum]|uniref:SIAH-type domain-containing protein n=1 Tax=Rhododendron griersonianum TaxID=479676 RepID=A0AAV6J760_9ERIC|nr:hypothetical protein RHGRI_023207 [Rhododendron griersonianum]
MVFCCKRHDHEDKCVSAPCSCPLPDCDFVGSSKNLSLHFTNKHANLAKRFCYNQRIPIALDKQQKYFVLQEQAEGSLFILNNGVELYGNVINVSCIGRSSRNTQFFYDLLVMNGGSSVVLKSFTEFVPAWIEHTPLERFLVVPNDFVGSCGKLKLELCIWRKPPESPAVL